MFSFTLQKKNIITRTILFKNKKHDDTTVEWSIVCAFVSDLERAAPLRP